MITSNVYTIIVTSLQILVIWLISTYQTGYSTKNVIVLLTKTLTKGCFTSQVKKVPPRGLPVGYRRVTLHPAPTGQTIWKISSFVTKNCNKNYNALKVYLSHWLPQCHTAYISNTFSTKKGSKTNNASTTRTIRYSRHETRNIKVYLMLRIYASSKHEFSIIYGTRLNNIIADEPIGSTWHLHKQNGIWFSTSSKFMPRNVYSFKPRDGSPWSRTPYKGNKPPTFC